MFTGGSSSAVGAHFVPVESGLFGSDVLVCHREFREPRGAGGRTGSQFLLVSQSGSGQLLGGSGPQDTDFRSAQGLKGLGSCCCARAGTGLSWDPLCSFLISCSTQCPCALALTAVPGLFLIPGCSSGPGSSEDGSGDQPDAGASAVHHGLRLLRQPPDQRHVLRVLQGVPAETAEQ